MFKIFFKGFLNLILISLAAISMAGCKRSSAAADVSFAKNTFESLARGDSSVSKHIDWETFTSLGTNVGASYTALKTDQERQDFARGFITQFATSFRESGGTVSSITGWRVAFDDENRTDVLADAPSGTLKISITTRDGMERLSSLDIAQ